MPTYRITSPEGKVYNVTGEGTKEQALAHFQFEHALQVEGASPELADLARSVHQQESGGGARTTSAAATNSGVVGPMQMKPSTFAGVADPDWDVNDTYQNRRAGIRYLKERLDAAGGDARLAAAGYYGGPGGQAAAAKGQARFDPKNAGMPSTLQYADQVTSRLPKTKAKTVPVEAPKDDIPRLEVGLGLGKQPAQDEFLPVLTSADQIPVAPPPDGMPPGPRDYENEGRLSKFLEGSRGAALTTGRMLSRLPALKMLGLAAGQGADPLKEQVEDYQTNIKPKIGGWGLAGEMAFDIPASGGAIGEGGAALARGIPELGRFAPAAGDIAANAIYSGIRAEAEGKDAAGIAKDTVMGGTGAAVGRAVAAPVKRIARALSRPFSEEGQALVNAGLPVTPGQAFGAGSAASKIEENLKYVPFVGGAVEARQAELGTEFVRRQASEALSHIGSRPRYGMGGNNLRMVRNAAQDIDKAYNDVVWRTFAQPTEVNQALRSVRAGLDNVPFTSAGHRRAFEKELDTIADEVYQHARSGPNALVSGRAMKNLDSALGTKARKYLESANPDHHAMGQIYRNLQLAMRSVTRGTTPEDTARLAAANRSFREFLPVETSVLSSLKKPHQTPDIEKLFKESEGVGLPRSDVRDAAVSVAPTMADRSKERFWYGLPGAGVAGFLSPVAAGLGLAGGRAAYSPTGIRAQMAALQALQRGRRAYSASGARNVIESLPAQVGRDVAED